MARFGKDRWPADGPVRALLEYLDELHRGRGQPSCREIGNAIGLAPSTVSPFFNGSRLISKENLELLVEFLEGDTAKAERLRRKARTAWGAPAAAQPSPNATGDHAAAPGSPGTPRQMSAQWPGGIKISGRSPHVAIGDGQTVQMNTTIKNTIKKSKKKRAKRADHTDQTAPSNIDQPGPRRAEGSQAGVRSASRDIVVVRPLRPGS